MNKLTVTIPVLNQQEITQKTLTALKSLQKNDNRFIIVDNGCDVFVRKWLMGLTGDDMVIKNDTNVGLPKALNQARFMSKTEYIFNTHSDIVMYEQDWDQKILDTIEQAKRELGSSIGVAGFFGALGIGTSDIYHSPYQMQQLVRTQTLSGDKCKLNQAIHHQAKFTQNYAKCAVLDGFGLICRNDLTFWEGFGPMHMYDSGVCLDSIKTGYKNIVINMDIDHIGGQTEVKEDCFSHMGKTKQQVHEEAHPPFYERYRDMLPYHI